MDNLPITDRAALVNRQAWDSIRRQRDQGLIAKHHDVAADILAGKTCLTPQHWHLAGTVSGKLLLDLGCGDGFELLEWARAGAQVVGVDNSFRQIAAAQRAADALGVPCRLVLADLLDLPDDLLRAAFDIVVSAWVTAWIGDLSRWFQSAACALKPGGVFLLSGRHPLAAFFAEQQRSEAVRENYFQEGPFFAEAEQSAAWNPAGDRYMTIEWRPTLSNIVTAVAQSGMRITHLAELGVGDATAKDGLPGYPEEFLLRAVNDR
jgi:SAM-dependent methyltransferase